MRFGGKKVVIAPPKRLYCLLVDMIDVELRMKKREIDR